MSGVNPNRPLDVIYGEKKGFLNFFGYFTQMDRIPCALP